MGFAEFERKKDEKIDGVIYDMWPAPGYRHGIIDSNIHVIIKQGLKNSLCLVSMENLDYKYHPDVNDDYNAETEICLKEFPHIKMTLEEIFEGLE